MAGRIRSARSGSDWTVSELDDYRIRIDEVDFQEFFEIVNDLPNPAVDDAILNHLQEPNDPLPDVHNFFLLLHEASNAQPHELVVDDFSRHILHVSGVSLGRVVVLREGLFFMMSGQKVFAKPDVVMRGLGDRILLVQEDKVSLPILLQPYISDMVRAKRLPSRHYEGVEPQLVAEMVAAFKTDDFNAIAAGNALAPQREYTAIIMIGTAPIFYKATITRALKEAIERAENPAAETVVQCLVPIEDENFLNNGMVPLDNRFVCFQCFEALRVFLLGQ
jgi:hypothetical protein